MQLILVVIFFAKESQLDVDNSDGPVAYLRKTLE